MKIFSYGSNMLSVRIKNRIQSFEYCGIGFIEGYSLKFHKASKDKSGKANAYFTGKKEDFIWGVIGEIDEKDKTILDKFEGLGKGYNEKVIEISLDEKSKIEANIYIADKECINNDLMPYDWYREYVLKGAIENSLPIEYIEKIKGIKSRVDENSERREKNFKIINEAGT